MNPALLRNLAELTGTLNVPPKNNFVRMFKAGATTTGEILKESLVPDRQWLKIYGVVKFAGSVAGFDFRASLDFLFKQQIVQSYPVEIADGPAGEMCVCIIQRSTIGTVFGSDSLIIGGEGMVNVSAQAKKVVAIADAVQLRVTKAKNLGGNYSVGIVIEQSTHPFP